MHADTGVRFDLLKSHYCFVNTFVMLQPNTRTTVHVHILLLSVILPMWMNIHPQLYFTCGSLVCQQITDKKQQNSPQMLLTYTPGQERIWHLSDKTRKDLCHS